jgi:hypothetical protein
MKQLQLVGISPEEHNLPIFNYIDRKIEEFKKLYQPKEPPKSLTRKEVAKMLSVDISSVHNMSKRGLYVRSEVESSIIKIIKLIEQATVYAHEKLKYEQVHTNLKIKELCQ